MLASIVERVINGKKMFPFVLPTLVLLTATGIINVFSMGVFAIQKVADTFHHSGHYLSSFDAKQSVRAAVGCSVDDDWILGPFWSLFG